ncbi:MAG: hypothetical protein HY726_09485 [Candidatus Rokubacteria bacterium]|nr:hypothetical protein [Candidatus Rokubacteria bacterium]
MSQQPSKPDVPPDRVFDFLQKFNRAIVLDEELTRLFPDTEFELTFDHIGTIYINGTSTGINVEERYRALRAKDEKTPTNTEVATSALEVLNDLMGEIHGARITGIKAIKQPEIFQTKYPRFIVRNSIGVIVLALRKFDDIWTNQIAPILLSDNLPLEGIELSCEIANRGLRKFCNLVIAHYSETKLSPKTPITTIEELLNQQGFTSDEDFLVWTTHAVAKIEVVRDCIAAKYRLSNRRDK